MWPTTWTETPQTLDLAVLRTAVRRIAPHIQRANMPVERAHRIFWSDGWVAATNGISFGAVRAKALSWSGSGVLNTWMLDFLFDLPVNKVVVRIVPCPDPRSPLLERGYIEIGWAGGKLTADIELPIPRQPAFPPWNTPVKLIVRADALREQIHAYKPEDGLLIEGISATAKPQARCEKLHTSLEKRRFGYPLFDRYVDARYLDAVLFTAQEQTLKVLVPEEEGGCFHFEGDDCVCLLGSLRGSK